MSWTEFWCLQGPGYFSFLGIPQSWKGMITFLKTLVLKRGNPFLRINSKSRIPFSNFKTLWLSLTVLVCLRWRNPRERQCTSELMFRAITINVLTTSLPQYHSGTFFWSRYWALIPELRPGFVIKLILERIFPDICTNMWWRNTKLSRYIWPDKKVAFRICCALLGSIFFYAKLHRVLQLRTQNVVSQFSAFSLYSSSLYQSSSQGIQSLVLMLQNMIYLACSVHENFTPKMNKAKRILDVRQEVLWEIGFCIVFPKRKYLVESPTHPSLGIHI